METIIGLILLAVGFWATNNGLNLDFPLIWFGMIVILDQIAYKLGAPSLLSKPKSFLQLLLVSAPFWWFYEWTNTYLKGWFYPNQSAFDSTTWALIATLSFSTVLPVVVVCTNLAQGIIGKAKNPIQQARPLGRRAKISKLTAVLISIGGLVSLFLTLFLPTYFFPLAWITLFLILDPANARSGAPSLIAQAVKRNLSTLLVLSVGALIVGFLWEGINFLVPKWTYPLATSPWFWNLPAPINTKIFEMPIAGFLGYIPFSWSAYAFVKYIKVEVPWLSDKS